MTSTVGRRSAPVPVPVRGPVGVPRALVPWLDAPGLIALALIVGQGVWRGSARGSRLLHPGRLLDVRAEQHRAERGPAHPGLLRAPVPGRLPLQLVRGAPRAARLGGGHGRDRGAAGRRGRPRVAGALPAAARPVGPAAHPRGVPVLPARPGLHAVVGGGDPVPPGRAVPAARRLGVPGPGAGREPVGRARRRPGDGARPDVPGARGALPRRARLPGGRDGRPRAPADGPSAAPCAPTSGCGRRWSSWSAPTCSGTATPRPSTRPPPGPRATTSRWSATSSSATCSPGWPAVPGTPTSWATRWSTRPTGRWSSARRRWCCWRSGRWCAAAPRP